MPLSTVCVTELRASNFLNLNLITQRYKTGTWSFPDCSKEEPSSI